MDGKRTKVIKVSKRDLLLRLSQLSAQLAGCEHVDECGGHWEAWSEFEDVLWLLGYSPTEYLDDEED